MISRPLSFIALTSAALLSCVNAVAETSPITIYDAAGENPRDVPDLNSAIEFINGAGGVIVELSNDTILDSALEITENTNLTLRSDGDTERTISGAETCQHIVFSGDTLELNCENIVFSSGKVLSNDSPIYGGSIYAGEASIVLNGLATFSDNTASSYYSSYGGAIYVDSSVDIDSNATVTFSGNTASSSLYSYGGAIYADFVNIGSGATVTFSGNTALDSYSYYYESYSYGGAIYAYFVNIGSDATVTFSGNTASAFSHSYSCGGAIYVDSSVNIDSGATVTFSGNTASSDRYSYGGAIYVDSVNIGPGAMVTFSGNTASSSSSYFSSCGGAIYTYTGGVNIGSDATVTFSGNTASSHSYSCGGAIYGHVGIGSGATVTFSDNTAVASYSYYDESYSYGGAIYGNVKIGSGAMVTFSGNIASVSSYSSSGGAIYGRAITFDGAEVRFLENKASRSGGAIYVADTLTFSGDGAKVMFSDNKIGNDTDGWTPNDIYAESGSTITIQDAGTYSFGGGIVSEGTLSIFEANVTFGSGSITTIDGAINISEGASVCLESGSTFTVGSSMTLDGAKTIVNDGTISFVSGATLSLGEDLSNFTHSGSSYYDIEGVLSTNGYLWEVVQIFSGDGTIEGLTTVSYNDTEHKLSDGSIQFFDYSTYHVNSGTATFETATKHEETSAISLAQSTVLNADIAPGNPTAFGGVISGEGSLTKTGSGTLTLSGENTYSGGTTISAGTLVAGNEGALGSGNLAIYVNGTLSLGVSSLRVSELFGAGQIGLATGTRASALTAVSDIGSEFSGTISGAISLTKTGIGTLTLSGKSTYTGGTNISAGVLETKSAFALGVGGITIAADATLSVASDLNVYSTIENAGTLRIASGATLSLGEDLSNFTHLGSRFCDIIGITSDNGYLSDTCQIFSGDGEVLNLEEVSYNGNVYELLSNGAIEIVDYETYYVNSGRVTFETATKHADTTHISLSAFTDLSVTSNISSGHSISLDRSDTFDRSYTFRVLENVDATLSGEISGNGDLTKTGSGTLTLSGENTYSGGTTVSAGTLVVGNEGALGSGYLEINGTLLLGVSSLRVSELFGSGQIGLATGTSASALTAVSDIGSEFSGTISGAISLTKTGIGTLTLSGENTYTDGTNISAGMLETRSASALGVGGITIAAGATLSVVSGLNVYSTIENAGTLQIESGAPLSLGGDLSGFERIENSNPQWGNISGKLSENGYQVTGQVVVFTGGEESPSEVSASYSGDAYTLHDGTLNFVDYSTYYVNSGTATFETATKHEETSAISLANTEVVLNATEKEHDGFNFAVSGAGTAQIALSSTKAYSIVLGDEFSGKANVTSGTIALNMSNIGSGSYVLEDGVNISSTVASSVSNSIVLKGAHETLASSGNLTLSGVISGEGALEKTGAGRLILSGANAYSGGTTISEGMLLAGNEKALGTGKISISSTGTLMVAADLNIYETIDNKGTMLFSSGSSLVVAGDLNQFARVEGRESYYTDFSDNDPQTRYDSQNGYSTEDAQIISREGTLSGNVVVSYDKKDYTLDGGAITIVDYSTYHVNSGTATFETATKHEETSAISLAQSTVLNADIAPGNPTVFGGVISGEGSLTKTGSGTLTLFGENTYSGGTTVSAGTLVVGNANALGAGGVSIAKSGTLSLGDSSLTLPSLTGEGRVRLTSGVSSVELTIGSDTDSVFSGAINGAITVTKIGSGKLTLSGTSDYSGGTVISEGSLIADSESALGTGIISISENGGLWAQSDLKIYGTIENEGLAWFMNDAAVILSDDLSRFSRTSDVVSESFVDEDGGSTENGYLMTEGVQVYAGGGFSGGLSSAIYKGRTFEVDGNGVVNLVDYTTYHVNSGTVTLEAVTSGGAVTNISLAKNTNLSIASLTPFESSGLISGEGALSIGLDADGNVVGGTQVTFKANAENEIGGAMTIVGSETVVRFENTGNTFSGGITIRDGASVELVLTDAAKATAVFDLGGNSLSIDDNLKITIADVITGGDMAVSLAAETAYNYQLFDGAAGLDESYFVLGKELEAFWQISGYAGGILTLEAIPEPAMFGLFAGIGALVLVSTRRRRKK